MSKKKIAFICVHNSCRSQIAEALGKHLAGDQFDFYSAGTETKPQINQDAVRLMKQLYGIDMEQSQYSKTIDKIPTPDIADFALFHIGAALGCRVLCFICRTATTASASRCFLFFVLFLSKVEQCHNDNLLNYTIKYCIALKK